MAVIAHHPVIVELEGVTLRLLAVDEDAASVVYLQVVALIHLDATLIYRQILQREGYRLALLRNPYRTVIIARPTRIGIQRIEVAISSIGIDGDALHQILVGLRDKPCG